MRHLRPSLKLALGALGASLAACRAPSPADAPEPAARPEVRYYMIADAWPFCVKVVAAVGELETEYQDRVDFTIIPAEETARSQAAIDAYGFTALKHGLVVFASDGTPRVKLPGHQYGEPEIRAAIEEVLAAE